MRPLQALLVAGFVFGANHAVIHADPGARGAPAAGTPQSNKERAIDPKADALLRKMSTDLNGMKSFTFESSQVMEVVTKDGEKLQGLAESSVAVQRPNKLRVDRMGPFGGGSVYYDGTNFTFYGKRDNLYATAKAPSNLDEMIGFARDMLSIDAPGADLLYSDAYTVLMEDVVSGRYMGAEMVGNRMCHHLAYRGNDTDWQIWVEDGARALPCRFVITSKKVTGAPQFTVSMSNWKAEQTFGPETFAFKPPPGAAKINFVTVSDTISTKKKETKR